MSTEEERDRWEKLAENWVGDGRSADEVLAEAAHIVIPALLKEVKDLESGTDNLRRQISVRDELLAAAETERNKAEAEWGRLREECQLHSEALTIEVDAHAATSDERDKLTEIVRRFVQCANGDRVLEELEAERDKLRDALIQLLGASQYVYITRNTDPGWKCLRDAETVARAALEGKT